MAGLLGAKSDVHDLARLAAHRLTVGLGSFVPAPLPLQRFAQVVPSLIQCRHQSQRAPQRRLSGWIGPEGRFQAPTQQPAERTVRLRLGRRYGASQRFAGLGAELVRLRESQQQVVVARGEFNRLA